MSARHTVALSDFIKRIPVPWFDIIQSFTSYITHSGITSVRPRNFQQLQYKHYSSLFENSQDQKKNKLVKLNHMPMCEPQNSES